MTRHLQWGGLQEHGSKLVIRHYEIGVLLLPSGKDLLASDSPWVDGTTMALPVPYQIPPPPYDFKHDRAWMWDEQYREKDVYGRQWL